MTQERIDAHIMAMQRLARSLLVSIRLAGGSTTRAAIVAAYSPCGWRPTHGELTDGLDYLVASGKARRDVGASGRADGSDCTITTV